MNLNESRPDENDTGAAQPNEPDIRPISIPG